MNQLQAIWLLSVLFHSAVSASMPQHGNNPQNVQIQSEPKEQEDSPKNPIETGLNHYTYRTPVLSANNGGYQRYQGEFFSVLHILRFLQ